MIFEGKMSVKIQIDHWVKIKTCQRFHFFPPHKVSLQGKNFEGKFSRQKWGLIKTRSVFVTSPMLGKM